MASPTPSTGPARAAPAPARSAASAVAPAAPAAAIPGAAGRGPGRAAAARRRAPGDVPTPPELARRLAAGFAPGSPAARGPWLDPACGSGALLLAALEVHGGPTSRCAGIEIDARKLARARERLAARDGHMEWGPCAGPPAKGPRWHRADALDPATPWPAGTHLLANPPWISWSGRHAGGGAPGDALADHHRGPGGWPALHAAFLARAARHLHDHGTEGRFLLPAAVATGAAYAALRAEVERWAHPLREPEWLDEDAFPGVHEAAILLHLAPGASAGPARWSPLPPPAEEDAALLRALDRCPRAPAGTFADVGMHTGNAARALLHERPAAGRVPIREGRDLAPFALATPRRHLDVRLAPTPERRFRRKPPAHYHAFPVLLRQTADRPIAALHEPRAVFRNSLLAARAIPGLDPAVLVAVLNHPLIARRHRARWADARRSRFPQVKIGHLRDLPLPFASRREAPALHDAIAARVRALRTGAADFEAGQRAVHALVTRAFGLPAAPPTHSSCPG